MRTVHTDDWLTLLSLGVLAFIVANVSHEAAGHGLATLAVGGKVDFITTCYVDSSGHYSKWIPAAGGLTNLAVGASSLSFLRLRPHVFPTMRYFLVLVAAFNLFFAVGYPAYSGIALFGDWTAVINGLNPPWIWRVVLVAVAVGGYYASMRLLIDPMAPFARGAEDKAAVPMTAATIHGPLRCSGFRGALDAHARRGLIRLSICVSPNAAAAAGSPEVRICVMTHRVDGRGLCSGFAKPERPERISTDKRASRKQESKRPGDKCIRKSPHT